MATGTGTETRKSFEDFVEKSETRAIGRALAALGIGTQFVGDELSEGDHIADAPVTGSNGHPAEPTHPMAEAIDRLFAVAESCREPKDMLSRRLKEIMGLPASTAITKKLVRASMTVTQYQVALAYYEQLLRRQVEEDVPNEPHAPTAAAAEPAPAPEVASSEQLRELRALASQADPSGKAQRDVVESFAHFPHGMPLSTYCDVHARLTRRLEEAKGGLALAEV
jgi:hypothetical protein